MNVCNHSIRYALLVLAGFAVSSTSFAVTIDAFSNSGNFLLEAPSTGDIDNITQTNTPGTPNNSYTRTSQLTNISSPAPGSDVFYRFLNNDPFSGLYTANGGARGEVVITYLDFMEDLLNNPNGVANELWTRLDLSLGSITSSGPLVSVVITDSDGTTGSASNAIAGVAGANTISLEYSDFLASASGGTNVGLNLESVIQVELSLLAVQDGTDFSLTDFSTAGSGFASTVSVPLPSSVILVLAGLLFSRKRNS